MADISNSKINECLNVERLNLRKSLKWKIKIQNPRKKKVSERVLRRAMHIIRFETLGRRLASATRLLVKLLARLLARLFALAKRLPRVSDRIICMALRKTLSVARFFLRGKIKRRNSFISKDKYEYWQNREWCGMDENSKIR